MLSILRSIVVVAAVTLIGAAASAQTMKWDMANEYGPTTVPGAADQRFANLVKEKSGGRLEIVNQFGGAINVKSKDMLDAIGTGALPLGHFPIQAASGADALFLVSNLPFIAQTAAESAILQDVLRPHLDALLKKNGQMLLYMTFFPPVGVWSKQPLATIADYKAVKLRTNDPISTTIFQKVGAAPLQLSWTDMLPQIQTGGVQAVHTSTSGGVLGQLWESLPYYNDVGTALAINVAVVNTDMLNKLAGPVKDAVLAAAADVGVWARSEMIRRIDEETALIRSKGGKIVEYASFPPEYFATFKTVSKPIIEDWLAKTGATGKAILDEFARKSGKTL